MIWFLIDYLLLSTLVLLPVVLFWHRIRQPAHKLVLGRIALGLLLLALPLLAWSGRPTISLQKTIVQVEESQQLAIANNGMKNDSDTELKNERYYKAEAKKAIYRQGFQPPRQNISFSRSSVSMVSQSSTEDDTVKKSVPEIIVQKYHEPEMVTPPLRETRTIISQITVANTIIAIYISGSFFTGLWLLSGCVRLLRIVRTSQEAPGEIIEQLQSISGKSRCTKICVNAELPSPIVYGALRPGIVLPDFLCDTTDEEKRCGLRFALAHEWSHIHSGDLWSLALCRILTLFLYPNPFFWRLVSLMREEQEILADAYAAAVTNIPQGESQGEEKNEEWENRRRYALELVRWFRMASSHAANPAIGNAALAICEFGKSKRNHSPRNPSLERRVEMLLQNDTINLKTSWIWKSCCITLVGAMMSFTAMFTVQPENILVAQNPVQEKTTPQKDDTKEEKTVATPEVFKPYDIPDHFKVHVVDEHGKSFPDVELFLNIWGEEVEKTYRETINTDENGVVAFDLAPIKGKKFGPFRLWVKAPGYVPLFASWDRLTAPYKPIPGEVTITMDKAIEYSGCVLNEQGEPIEGVAIKVVGPGGSSDANSGVASQSPWLNDVKTDAQGHWSSDRIPPKGNIRFSIKHPEYLDVEYGSYKAQEGMTPEKLRDGTAVYVMQQGIPVTGTVTDENGEPLSGVTVRIGSNDMINYWGNKSATTDEHGKYKIFWKEETCPIMASAQGKAPELKMVTVTKLLEPQDFVLQPGRTITFKFVDQNDQPVPKAYVMPLRWRGTERYFDDKLKGNRSAGEDGVWTWNEAPMDSVQYFVSTQNLRSEKPSYVLEPQEEPYTIRMLARTKATGHVIDAQTKKPIPAFTINPGYQWSENYGKPTLQTSTSQGFTDGTFQFIIDRGIFGYNLRFTAEGYLPYVTETFKIDENADLTIELIPAESIGSVVLLPDDTPAENANVYLFSSATGTQSIWNEEVHNVRKDTHVVTKSDGRFTFPPQLEGYVIAIFHDAGAAQVYADDLKSGSIKLKPWSRIDGVVKKENQPWPEKYILAAAWINCDVWDENRPEIQFIYTASSDENGKFHFDRVMPGREILVAWEENYGRSPLDHFAPSIRSDNVTLQSEPGQTASVTLGGVGRPVSGKIIVTSEKFKDKIQWEFAKLNLNGVPENMSAPDYASLPVPDGVNVNDSTAFNKWYRTWIEEDEKGKAFRETVQKYNKARPANRSSRIEKDGTFRVENVPPGRYEVSVEVFQPKPNEEIPLTGGTGLGGNISGRMRLQNTRHEPIITVPKFDGTTTDVPAELGVVSIELFD